jgi:hypothetical protein
MTEIEAIELLRHHSYDNDDIENAKTEKGFLGMLRPFNGQLYEENFHEIMTLLRTLKQQFRSEKIDRQIISSFWNICHFTHVWALDPEGMLRRNSLLSDQQIKQLCTWIDCISYAIMGLLDGLSDEQAFEFYDLYLKNDNR